MDPHAENVRRGYADAVAEHGELGVDVTTFAAALEERSGASEGDHCSDLYLVLGCVCGNRSAIATFHRLYVPVIDTAIRRVCTDADFLEEARQRVLTRLLVGDQQVPRIASYGARGPLRGWTRVAATRVALALRDQVDRRPTLAVSVSAILVASSGDLELESLKRRYASELQAGMLHGLHSLEPRERTVLRLNAFEGLNIEAIGNLYGVHRSTVARWIANARAAILAAAQAHFQTTLGVGAASFEDLSRVLVSQLDLRVSQLEDS